MVGSVFRHDLKWNDDDGDIIKVGAAVSVGEQPIKGLVNPEAGARMTIAECLTNLVFAPITDIKDIKMSGNWMWAAKCEGEGARLVRACTSLCTGLKEIGCAIDGGKDSLSMAARVDDELVKAPGTIVLSAYVGCTDINKVVTPVVTGDMTLIHIRMDGSSAFNRLGGSALAQCFGQIGNNCPDVDDFTSFVQIFNMIQHLIKNGTVQAGHDISDGGLITCLLEIAFSSNIQLECSASSETDILQFFFAEESGVVIAVDNADVNEAIECLKRGGASPVVIGYTEARYGPDAHVRIKYNGLVVVHEPLNVLREIWEETSDRLGTYQTTSLCLEQERKNRMSTRLVKYYCNFDYNFETHIWDESYFTTAPNIAIIREEGSNGDREMAAAFAYAGFQTFDVAMTDLLEGHTLAPYKGIAFVGGFSYADVLGSARGWAATIQYHEDVSRQFKDFYSRRDTFSFGVCNGCQLMTQLGWIGEFQEEANVFLKDNTCGRFESFFGPVLIEKTPSIMLKDMEGSVLGLWSSHGEGRFTFKSSEAYGSLKPFVALRYVNSEGQVTEEYPWNPNGSIEGTAAICSKDGRHLAMMPHSDRTFMTWQWPSYPLNQPGFQSNKERIALSPWSKMFRNAYEWVRLND
ncbi:unnamed protein product [Auanema sp. JU1783]|nr:unnamed protein product [Auanema sp. JU1783]